jgi:hypothetical protein
MRHIFKSKHDILKSMNKNFQILVITLLINPITNAKNVAVPGGHIDCTDVEANYTKVISQLDLTCTKHEECHVDKIGWNPSLSIVHKESSEMIQQLLSSRSEMHKLCQYTAALNGSEKHEAICLDGKCQNISILETMKNNKITFKFTHKGYPLRNQKVPLTADTGIRCEMAPCRSRKDVAILNTDANGIATITVGEFQNIYNKPNYVGPDGLAFSILNVGFVVINFKSFLLNTKKVNEIQF